VELGHCQLRFWEKSLTITLKPALSVNLNVASPLRAEPMPVPTIRNRPREIFAKSFHIAASFSVLDARQSNYPSTVPPKVP
jgi:hypothetical protein